MIWKLLCLNLLEFGNGEFDLLTEIVSNCRESNWNLEMATYTEFHQPDIASDRQHSQDVSISQILDHGSISFGRFAVESLAWEKWSVFRQNRCQEELEMYKSNGLVAQKKAYFEDYYKRVRGLKALEVQHQETTQPDPCPDVKINTMQLVYGNCHDLSKQKTCGNDTVANSDSSLSTIVDKPRQAKQQPLNDCNDNTDKVIMADEANNTSSNVEPEQARIDASLSPTPSVTSSSRAAQHDSLVSDPVKNDADKPKKHAPPVLKAKVNAALTRNKSKLDCRITKDAVKSLEKSKPLCSSATVPHHSSTRSRLVPYCPSGRSDSKKANSNEKKLADRLQTNLPVHARSVQNTSNEKSIACGLKNMAVEKRSCIGVSRKLLDLGNQQMRRKVGQSENQRPKSMFTNNPARVDSERKNYGKERKEKEGKEENNAADRRYPKPASTATSSVHKNVKVVHKIAELKSGILPRCGYCADSKCQARSSSPVKSMRPVQQEECAVAFIMRQSLQKRARTSAIDWNVRRGCHQMRR
ncbi:protein WVD2-like 7 [Prunus yedoensis var. nudiflora]|uniref:Protein WVD2-like 7 n=1 Tax=Prunus yedoensis var. nudiflora TaxID=2094558 RepID=A0A314YDJ5_PRUYE|nr:protein WVD2-like 7 [Prunus yedoensis var. nudiflora]